MTSRVSAISRSPRTVRRSPTVRRLVRRTRPSRASRSETAVITREFAEDFAAEWITAWNAHDLDRVLEHYADDFELSSPFIVKVAGEPSGVLRGRAAVRAYWAKALALRPELRFELLGVYCGIASIVI